MMRSQRKRGQLWARQCEWCVESNSRMKCRHIGVDLSTSCTQARPELSPFFLTCSSKMWGQLQAHSVGRWASRGQQGWGWNVSCLLQKSQHRVKRAQLPHNWHQAGILSIASLHPSKVTAGSINGHATICKKEDSSIKKWSRWLPSLSSSKPPYRRF